MAADRIGEMNYLGQDGKTAAGAGNPPMMVTVGGQQFLVPMIVPLTDYQSAPDLRPGGANVPSVTEIAPTHECLNGMLGAFEAKNIYPYTEIYDNFTSVGYI